MSELPNSPKQAREDKFTVPNAGSLPPVKEGFNAEDIEASTNCLGIF
jgi:hypothetical protein